MDVKLFLVLFYCAGINGAPSYYQAGYGLALKGVTQYLGIGNKPSYLEYVFQNFKLPYIFSDPEDDNSDVCTLCGVVAEAIISERRLGMSDVQLTAEVSYFCTILGFEDERVCEGIIKSNVHVFGYIIDNGKNVTGERFCGLLLQGNNCNDGNYEWTIDIPAGQTIPKSKPSEISKFNILHLSDIHYDPLYTPGKLRTCSEPLCCQSDQEDGTSASNSCGYWSDYENSDVPLHTVQETLRQSATHEFDYVYYTGDTISHRVWATSVANNSRDITAVTDLFREHYSVPVYPALGNHEPHPLNVWSSDGVIDPTVSSQWLFDLVADQWAEWLPEDAQTTLRKGGFYTVSPREGFRVIVLNTNVCYNENWWLVFEDEDPYGQLAWLAQTLLAAEQNRESVHILAHIPAGGGSCLKAWSREYGKLVQRFANTITGQFNGHSHRDTFSVYYSSDSNEAINMAWNGGSVIVDGANPNYRLYQIDDETFDVLDYEEWTFNLTLANSDSNKAVEWYKLYSFRDAYDVNSLEPSEIYSLVQRMAKDPSLINKFNNYKFRNSDNVVRRGCDESCQREILCSIVISVHNEDEPCANLLALYDER